MWWLSSVYGSCYPGLYTISVLYNSGTNICTTSRIIRHLILWASPLILYTVYKLGVQLCNWLQVNLLHIAKQSGRVSREDQGFSINHKHAHWVWLTITCFPNMSLFEIIFGLTSWDSYILDLESYEKKKANCRAGDSSLVL